MKRRYSSRTRPSPAFPDDPFGNGEPRGRGIRKFRRGNVTVIVLLLFVIFTGLGLAALHASGVHMRINAFRKFSSLLDCASENGLKRGLRDLTAWLESAGLLAAVPAERVEAFRESPRTEFPLLLEAALGSAFPRFLEESFGGMTWESRAECGFGSFADMGNYVRISAGLRIEASGGLLQVRPRRLSALEGSLGLLAGRLPLPAIPLYVKKDMTDGEKAAFLEENGISFPAKAGQLIGPGLTASAGGVVPEDAGQLVAKALNIGIFEPGDLSPAELRQALRLEPSMEPVPDGVYLIENDLGLGGVFVEGDLDEMVLAIRGDAQVVVFRMDGAEWVLEFSPARSRTEFRTPEGSRAYDLVPLPIVIVDGMIDSLGGGAIDTEGRVELCFDEGTPAVLNGVDLAIVTSEKVTISSHLVLEGVRWQDGVPYAKDSRAQLVIFAAGKDIVSGEPAEGGIAVADGAPSGLKLQASLTAASGGFDIEGTGKDVELMGALHAGAFSGNGNTLALVRDDRAAAGIFPANAPLTASPRLAFYSLRVLAWKEY